MAWQVVRSGRPLTVIADDATGALEAGVLLARNFDDVRIDLEFDADQPQASVVLIPTRHLACEAAWRLMRDRLPMINSDSLFLKTDSTLRGPIGACLQALLDARPGTGLVYIPAYPALGRTVREGVLSVNGQPLAETEFASDPLNPIRTSSVLAILAAGCAASFRHAATTSELEVLLAHPERPIAVCDAQSEDDVNALIQICLRSSRPVMLAGPAGCLRHFSPPDEPGREPPLPHLDRWLLVCGSRHPVSRAQAEAAASEGVDVVQSPEALSPNPAAEAQTLAAAAANRGARAFIVFGGDTALALWRHLGVRSLEPLREILPGVAVSRSGPFVFVTKAGGFGPPDLVARILENWNQ
jgi:uncharacterized protein YgbK (DUF1537 family)